jgi:hypothetical protein
MRFLIIILTVFLSNHYVASQKLHKDKSAACIWMDVYLEAIKKDGLGPTIHARNMFHISAAMYDAWLIYHPEKGEPYYLGKTNNGFEFEFDGFDCPINKDSAEFVSISFAAFRLMELRFQNYSSKVRAMDDFIFLMEEIGLDPYYRSTDYSDGNAAGLGNYIAEKIFEFGLAEQAGDEDGYEAPLDPVNPSLRPDIPGNKRIVEPNRWQPLSVIDYINQKGWDSTLRDWNYQLILAEDVFLTPHWGQITPFAMTTDDVSLMKRDGQEFKVYNDPGPPPYINTSSDEQYVWNHTLVASWSGHNDPNNQTKINISPGAIGPTSGLLPESFEEYKAFFDFQNGGTVSKPNRRNPITGNSYASNLVKRGDYTRVIAEYWVDAVNTYSPPGHWMKMLQEVSDDTRFERKWMGKGKVLDQLEWDIISYLALSGALHDAAISAWSIKAYYDYVRPISAIRWMSDNGQSSDSLKPRYHEQGLPLIPGKIELVRENDPLVGENKENINKLKIYSWRGPDYVDDVETDVAGSGWILAENWWPYQRYSFATPPFAGYVSGHSTFSVAAAEVMTAITGSPYFPGGLREQHFNKNDFLEFEKGPSDDITLQWATYREAADETCLSRIWGGIHPPIDDIEGRKVGERVAKQSILFLQDLFR